MIVLEMVTAVIATVPRQRCTHYWNKNSDIAVTTLSYCHHRPTSVGANRRCHSGVSCRCCHGAVLSITVTLFASVYTKNVLFGSDETLHFFIYFYRKAKKKRKQKKQRQTRRKRKVIKRKMRERKIMTR